MEYDLFVFMGELFRDLNRRIERRIVSTFVGLGMAINIHRHRNPGLWGSELGGYLWGPERCCAGTKRTRHLIHSEKWTSKLIGQLLEAGHRPGARNSGATRATQGGVG